MVEIGFILAIAASAASIVKIDKFRLFAVLNSVLMIILIVGGVVFSTSAILENETLRASLIITATALTFLFLAKSRQRRIRSNQIR